MAERVDGPWELRRAIRNRLRENPDAIKIWSTGEEYGDMMLKQTPIIPWKKFKL